MTSQAIGRSGSVDGLREDGVYRFSAIPYAEPPLGSLRFRPPVPRRWEGHVDATQSMPVAPQWPSRLSDAVGGFEADQSEDCLKLTIWTPAPDSGRRPVLIWLHGGAWQSGGAAIAKYAGARLAARGDMVVVAPNYRLSALGWLHVPGETANVGLLDQEAAIRWVRDNIEAFGGDPTRITLMGQSAGAASIAYLLARKNSCERVILQSPWIEDKAFLSAERATVIGEAFLRAAQARDLDGARRLPVEVLLEAQRKVIQDWKGRHTGMAPSVFGPVADGDVLPIDLPAAMRHAASRADVLIGHTSNELAAFPGMEISEASQRWGDDAFGAPARQWAAHAKSAGRKAWFYRFDYAPSTRFGACHCIELPFVFDTHSHFADAPMMAGAQAGELERLTGRLQGSWIDFVHGRSPWREQWPEMAIF